MAQINYNPVPSATPQTEAPNDLQREESTPASFGAGAAQGVEAAGQGVLEAGKFYNQVAADDAGNQRQQAANKLLYGDPSKTTIGPDGTPVPDTGYFGLTGAAAMSKRQEVSEELDEIDREHGESLSTPAARQQYEIETRRYRFQADAAISQHADQQQKEWMVNTNQTSAQISLDNFSRNPNDPNLQTQTLNDVRKAYVRMAQVKGTDPREAIQMANQLVASHQVRALLPTDPQAAKRALDANTDVLSSSPEYDSLSREVQARIDFDQNHSYTDVLRQEEIEAKAKRQASDSAANTFMTQLIKDPTKLSTTNIANNPDLTWQDKAELARALKERLTSADPDVRDDKTYGSGIYSEIQRLHLPDGDPGKLTDPSQVYPLIGRGLTVSGANYLIGEITRPKGPEGTANALLANEGLKSLHEVVTAPNGIKVPGSEDVWIKALPKILKAETDGKAKGLTTQQLWDPASKDYVGGVVKDLKPPTDGSLLDDTIPAAPRFDPSSLYKIKPGSEGSSAGIALLQSAVNAGSMTRAQARQAALAHGWATLGAQSQQQAPQAVPAVQ